MRLEKCFIKKYHAIVISLLLLACFSTYTFFQLDHSPRLLTSSLTIGDNNLSESEATLVTALYDIGREKQGRSMATYLKWFSKTLTLNAPFIIFIPSSLETQVRAMRRGNSYTHFIVRDTFPLDAFSHLVKMHILKSSFRKKIRKPKDITMINPRYALVQHSKMFWMAEAIKLNPFQTQTFFWMDAGYSRFIPDKAFVKPFPVSSKVDWLVREKKMYVGVARATKKEMDKMTEITLDDAVGTSKSFFEGNMWGGWGEAVYQMATTTLSLFFEALSLNSIDNEQVTMFLAYKKHPSTFAYVKVKNADAGFTYMSTEE